MSLAVHEFRIAPAGRFTAYGIAAVVITVGGFVTYVSVTPSEGLPDWFAFAAAATMLGSIAGAAFLASPRHRFTFDGSALRIDAGSASGSRLIPYDQLASFSVLESRRGDMLELKLARGETLTMIRSYLLPGRDEFRRFVDELDGVLASSPQPHSGLSGGHAPAASRRTDFWGGRHAQLTALFLAGAAVVFWILTALQDRPEPRHLFRTAGVTLVAAFYAFRVLRALRAAR